MKATQSSLREIEDSDMMTMLTEEERKQEMEDMQGPGNYNIVHQGWMAARALNRVNSDHWTTKENYVISKKVN